MNELPAVVLPRAKRTPAEVRPRVHRLGERRCGGGFDGGRGIRKELFLETEAHENAARDAVQRNRGAQNAGYPAAVGDHDGHTNRRFVKQETMRALAVVAQPFPMIGGHHDAPQRPRTPPLQLREKRSHRAIDERHFAAIRVVPACGSPGMRRDVRCVRIEKMHPAEERDIRRRGARAIEEAPYPREDFVGPPLRKHRRGGLLRFVVTAQE